MSRKKIIVLCALLVVGLSGCALGKSGPSEAWGVGGGGGVLKDVSVSVASKDFTEQLVLCEITAQRLESQGANVDRTCGMTGSSTVRSAVVGGDVDMYWEYTGTGWLTHLKETDVVPDAGRQYTKVRDLDRKKNAIEWLPPAPANNTYAIAVKDDVAERLGVKTISDYAKLAASKPKEATFCGASEFFGRDDGWEGVQKRYDFKVPKSAVATLAEGPIYNAVAKSEPCNFGEVFATDGRVAALGLTLLEDDRKFFPFYNASLTVRAPVIEKTPEIKSVMEPVRALLDDKTLQTLNAKVDVDGRSPEEAARAWLSDYGLN